MVIMKRCTHKFIQPYTLHDLSVILLRPTLCYEMFKKRNNSYDKKNNACLLAFFKKKKNCITMQRLENKSFKVILCTGVSLSRSRHAGCLLFVSSFNLLPLATGFVCLSMH